MENLPHKETKRTNQGFGVQATYILKHVLLSLYFFIRVCTTYKGYDPEFSRLNFYEGEVHGFFSQAKSPGPSPSGARTRKFSQTQF